MTIREYNVSDKKAVLKLLRLNTPAYFAPEEEKDFINYLDKEIDKYFVLEYEGKVVGCGGINFSDDRIIGKISWDIFHPAYQGKGLGRELLKFRVEYLKSFKVKGISVRTSQLVYKFYEKQGFVLRETIKDYWAPGIDMYRMEYASLNL